MNDVVRILLLTVLPVVVAACVVGVVMGRYKVKKAAGQLNPILSSRERIVCACSVTLGVVLLLFGIFYQPPRADLHGPDDWGFMVDDASVAEEWVPDQWDNEFFDDPVYDWDDDEYFEFEHDDHPEVSIPTPPAGGGTSSRPVQPRPVPGGGGVVVVR